MGADFLLISSGAAGPGTGGCRPRPLPINYPLLSIRRDKGTHTHRQPQRYLYIIYNNNTTPSPYIYKSISISIRACVSEENDIISVCMPPRTISARQIWGKYYFYGRTISIFADFSTRITRHFISPILVLYIFSRRLI